MVRYGDSGARAWCPAEYDGFGPRLSLMAQLRRYGRVAKTSRSMLMEGRDRRHCDGCRDLAFALNVRNSYRYCDRESHFTDACLDQEVCF